MTNTHIIQIENAGGTRYWSQYGNFTTKRKDAKEYSKEAAEAQLRNLHSIARHNEEHVDWINARVEWAELVTIV